MADSSSDRTPFDAGRDALAGGRWDAARGSFAASIESKPSGQAYEGLSWATWWLEEADACLNAREHAHRRYLEEGDLRGAARMALWMGDDLQGFKGAGAVADGWFRRAARLLVEIETCPEHGWLAAFEAHAALWNHDLDTAAALAADAQRIGQIHHAVDLHMFGLATEGAIRVARADVRTGLRCLDEAAASAVAGDYENLVPAAWTCCLMLAACEQVRDVDRAAQWCEQIDHFSRQFNARFVTGVCQAHFAVVLMWRGDWTEAERRLLDALTYLTERRPTWRPEAIVRLARLRQQQGRLDDAVSLLEQAQGHPLTMLTLAAIAADRDDGDGARNLLERALRRFPASQVTSRIDILEALVRGSASSGDFESAQSFMEEFQQGALKIASDPYLGSVAASQGLVAAASGYPSAAADHFEDAVDILSRSHLTVEAARARLGLAATLIAQQRFAPAREEARRALSEFERIGAAVDARRGRALLERIEPPAEREKLTGRQIEILRLIAAGHTDQEIATELLISSHTVHRHVANIYNRLGCSTRAAAVAEASRLGLL